MILLSFFSLTDNENIQPTRSQPTNSPSIETTSTLPSLVPSTVDVLEIDIDRLIAFKNAFKIDPRK